MSDDMEAMRADVLTGRADQQAEAENYSLSECVHCADEAEFRFLCRQPYVACTGCGATTATGETLSEAAGKWNRRT